MKSNEAAFQQAVQWLRSANRVVVFTGAGVSAESGIPTFRDQLTGLWAKFDPAQLATADAFRNDPALVWGWYEWRRALVAAAKPNPASTLFRLRSASSPVGMCLVRVLAKLR